MSEKLIGLKDLKKNFKIVKIENSFVYFKLHRGQYVPRVKLPFKPNEKLASLFGHVLGDGCIKAREESFCYVNKNKDLIEEVKRGFKELFEINTKERFNGKRGFYEVQSPKVIAKFLVLCGFPKGEKMKQILTIPNWIKNGSFKIKSAFIRALFDDEGTVIHSKGNYVIGFSMNKQNFLLDAHKKFVEEIRKILFSLGVSPNKIYKRKQPFDTTSIGFNIYGRYNLMKFLTNIGFTDKRKEIKLINTINSFKTCGKNEIKRRILNSLKNGPLRTKELSVMINRDRKIIWKNLHKLEQSREIEKMLISKRGPIEKVFWELKKNNDHYL